MKCMRHGFTQPSRPHSSNSSREERVRKIQEYDAARPPYISPRIFCNESTPEVNSAAEDHSESEPGSSARSREHPNGHLAPPT